jgi:hypothetical protein
MAPNFTECGELFKSALSQTPNPYAKWAYLGPLRGVLRLSDRPAVITTEGCLAVCGTGFQAYKWAEASNTITTWVLPVIGGLLLQAPFESNRFWRTFFSLTRWMGSPMSSLSNIFWNIKVTGKCALMVDMAVPFNEVPADENSEFAQMRDAFYILAVMNQYEIKSHMPDIPAEKLLRIALFSDSLKLSHAEDDVDSLPKLRRSLAFDLRRGRRRGTVPVFISVGWFVFSLAISIQSAFGDIGVNAIAHNLALGLMLSWIPVFIIGSIIDRNPLSSDDIRLRLNDLLDRVRLALLNTDLRDTYIRDTGRAIHDYQWTQALENHDYFSESFFTDFAGQGRSRWHYGVAHPILAGIEKAYVADYGRDWLCNPERARTAMVVGPEQLTGLKRFDWREIWQILSAVAIVLGTMTGAIVISYWTPTVGLGCRSGGYVIFITIAFASLCIEMLFWWQMPTGSESSPEWLQRAAMGDPLINIGGRLERQLSRSQRNTWQASLGGKIQTWMQGWESLQFRSKVEILVLKPLDILNMCWLIYIAHAQTFGWYRTCTCMSSVWASGGGYIDFEGVDSYKAHGIALYWGIGTALTLFILSSGLLFIIAEWCSQSHLSTMNYDAASRGLKRTRWWKYYTVWLRRAPNVFIESVVVACRTIFVYLSQGKRGVRGRRSLIWSASIKRRQRPPLIVIHGVSLSDSHDDEDIELLNRTRWQGSDMSLRSISSPAPGYFRPSSPRYGTEPRRQFDHVPAATFKPGDDKVVGGSGG